MRKQSFVILAAITLLVLGAIAFGVGRMQVASAHVQAPVVQVQLNSQQGGPDQETQDAGAALNGTEKDSTDPVVSPGSVEDQGQDQDLPGGGYQDRSQVDHQFEGTE